MLHQIGVGALGPVFRTYEPARDRLVAVKVFRLDITPEKAQALADELTRAAEAGLFHPSIVEPIAAGVQGTVAYRAEEYVAAESLDVAMRHYAPADIGKVLPFITQLAGAVDFARAAGVGHGALHPRDIFVTPDEARATGFGVVDALERVGLRAPVRRPYSPPERIAGEAWGAAADVFSLAAIAYEMLTGRRPAGTGDHAGPLAPPAGGPHAAQVRAVLVRAMLDDPARRYGSALAFAAALEAAARGETASEASATAVPVPAPVSAVSGVAAPAVASAAVDDPVPDDIAVEREDDAAHWDLAREEQDLRLTAAAAAASSDDHTDYALTPPDPEADASAPLDPDEPISAGAADHPVLRFEAAESAAEPDRRFADDFEPEPPPERAAPTGPLNLAGAAAGPRDATPRRAVTDAPAAPEPRVAPPVVPAAASSASSSTLFGADRYERPSGDRAGEPRIVAERPGGAMLPLAVTLVVGLLIGFAIGYFVGDRGGAARALDQASAGTQAGDAAPGDAQPQPAEPRASTEAAVSPTAGDPAAVPAQPPSVPAETAAPPAAPPRTSTPTPAPRGRIVVRSTPSRAAVTLNGKWSGRTPLTLDDLPLGSYAIRVVADGYRVAQERVDLSGGRTSRTLTMRLEREPAARGPEPRASAPEPSTPARAFTGSLFVDSRPQGARVFVDGKEYGTTPVRIPEVGIGSHVVRLELPDHRVWTSSVRIVSGEERRVTGSLEPIRQP